MKRKSLKMICSVLVLGLISTSLAACASKKDGENSKSTGNIKIAISGSTSVGPLMEKLAENYENKNEGITIEINQIGSSAGIKDTINGVSEIGMASRELKDEEKKEVKGTVIAYDGIAIILNKNNRVKDLNIDQIKGIYTGAITNWKQIEGGKDSPIVVVSREEGSGTRDAFQEIIGYESKDLVKDAMISNGNGGVKETVVGNENAIGFVSFEYLDDSVNVVTVEGTEASAEAVKAGKYKISRPFNIVTKDGNLTTDGQKFIDFILSTEGQQIVEDNKLITIE
ncbi:phosphate ABC transporter substrate-binding protein [Clostridium isatidis]|uniref:Phosphate-binding protein n=1 Tax=Clostridium isatidis TaxID=182773 RepID=A0A343JBT0_9CLOT|nr:phosphate ABC transporter substrate-binding protein [Clostridium isatidis]ASW42988.1 phosphate ABC transporter substrate-binding protein [Clostridium isatidis]